MRITNIVGARPNFVKISPLLAEMKKYPQIEPLVIHTCQHYDYEMSKQFFEDLDIPEPDYYLGVGSGSHDE
ncbi:MAG: UDP-N-acetylglucosamine 2-epimerase [bacterium]